MYVQSIIYTGHIYSHVYSCSTMYIYGKKKSLKTYTQELYPCMFLYIPTHVGVLMISSYSTVGE